LVLVVGWVAAVVLGVAGVAVFGLILSGRTMAEPWTILAVALPLASAGAIVGVQMLSER
jgi:hypothetical protein